MSASGIQIIEGFLRDNDVAIGNEAPEVLLERLEELRGNGVVVSSEIRKAVDEVKGILAAN